MQTWLERHAESHMTTETLPVSALNQLTRLAETSAAEGRYAAAARLYQQAAQHAASGDDYPQALALIERALALAADNRPAERFSLLFQREQVQGLLGQRGGQLRDLASLEALADALDDDGRRAIVAARQAEWRAADGDVGMAISLATLAVRLARLSGAVAAEGTAQLTLGRALGRQAHFTRAATHLQAAIATATEIGDNDLRASALRSLGVIHNDSERFQDALTCYTQAEALYAGLGDIHGRARVLNNRGHVHAHQGQLGLARRAWQETEHYFSRLNDVPSHMRALLNLGTVYIDLGQYEEATRLLEQAHALAQQIQLVPGICFSALNLGLAAQRQGRHAAALPMLEQALAIARQMGAQHLEAAAQMVLGHAYSGLGQFAAAGDAYWTALALREALALPNQAAEARAGLARIAHRNNAPGLARGFVEPILAQLARDARLDGAESPVEVLYTCYEVLHKAGDRRAPAVLRQAQDLLQARLASIQDDEARRAMGANIAVHRALLAMEEEGG